MLQELGPTVLKGREVEGIFCGAAWAEMASLKLLLHGSMDVLGRGSPLLLLEPSGAVEAPEGINRDLANPESPQEMLIGALCLKARAMTA